jgi:hypothetical protein
MLWVDWIQLAQDMVQWSSTVNMINTFGLHNLTPQSRVILKKSMAADKVHRYLQSHKAHFVSCSRNTRQGLHEPAKSTSMCNFVTSCLWRWGVVIHPFNTQGVTGTPNFPSDKKKLSTPALLEIGCSDIFVVCLLTSDPYRKLWDRCVQIIPYEFQSVTHKFYNWIIFEVISWEAVGRVSCQ